MEEGLKSLDNLFYLIDVLEHTRSFYQLPNSVASTSFGRTDICIVSCELTYKQQRELPN